MKTTFSLALMTTVTLAATQIVWADDSLSVPATNHMSESLPASQTNYLGEKLFQDNEAAVDAFGVASIGRALAHSSTEHFRDYSRGGMGLGGNYFFLRYFGIGGDAYSVGTSARFIDSTSGNLILRLPCDQLHLAPYMLGGAGYQFDPNERQFGQVGGGLEYRITQHWGLITDACYVFPDAAPNRLVARGGLRFSF